MQIDHVIVLMMENRSFDHMLGYLDYANTDTQFEGLVRQNEGRFRDGGISPTPDSDYQAVGHPDHSHRGTMWQMTGSAAPTGTPPAFPVTGETGYVANFAKKSDTSGEGIMKCFGPGTLGVLGELAKEFAVCDHWFASVPGGTFPNRDFAIAGTSMGYGQNPFMSLDHWKLSLRNLWRYTSRHKALGEKNIFSQLIADEKTANVYRHDLGHIYLCKEVTKALRRDPKSRMTTFDTLLEDIDRGELPNFSWVEPDYSPLGSSGFGNSQHPSQAGSGAEFIAGEQLIADIYNALIARQDLFEKTLFVITYDEHGGYYDHVRPPAFGDGTENGRLAISPGGESPWGDSYPPEELRPTGHSSDGYTFDFTQFGPRVPTVIVNPYIARNTVDSTVYDHTSIIATVRKTVMSEGVGHFTARDRDANSFDRVLTLSQARSGFAPLRPSRSYEPPEELPTEESVDDWTDGSLACDMLVLAKCLDLDARGELTEDEFVAAMTDEPFSVFDAGAAMARIAETIDE